MNTGLVLDIKRYAVHDGPGIRTTVFLSGCSLVCWWCHNPESQPAEASVRADGERCISCGECEVVCPGEDGESCRVCGRCVEACPTGARELLGRTMTSAEVVEAVERDRVFYETSGGGVTFSGGEPLKQPDFLVETLRACGERGLHRAVDTSGYAEREALVRVAEETDLFLYDLKAVDPDLHRAATGWPNDRILANLEYLAGRDLAVEIRYPLVPGVSDLEQSVELAGAFLRSLPGSQPVRVLPFHRAAEMKHRRLGRRWRGGEIEPGLDIAEVRRRLAEFGLPIIEEGTTE